jgi:hypothetical protein
LLRRRLDLIKAHERMLASRCHVCSPRGVQDGDNEEYDREYNSCDCGPTSLRSEPFDAKNDARYCRR